MSFEHSSSIENVYFFRFLKRLSHFPFFQLQPKTIFTISEKFSTVLKFYSRFCKNILDVEKVFSILINFPGGTLRLI